ncbi:MAG: protein kinase, partial [Candidatus Hydrogenedentes bacterium]|nr:protein kinase [Candidatus Hydrogenedentota bacterium]
KGGMGAIFRAQDNILNEEVALKTLLPQFAQDKLIVDRFYNEARIARQLSHPNIIRVHDIGIAQGLMYISMEYIRGQSLRQVIDAMLPGQRLPIRTTLMIMTQLCDALEYAHQFTVHRDIKPENVMVLKDGTVKLMDFGISKLMSQSNMTATSVVMGTPKYMSPEQLRDSRSVDARTDIFSMGVMLYEIITGNLPTGIPKPASQVMSEIPPALDPIISKCVEPDPKDRYRTAPELCEDLRAILAQIEAGSDVTARPGGADGDTKGLVRAIGLVLILLVVLLTAASLWQFDKRRTKYLDQYHQAASAAPSGAQDDGYERLNALVTSALPQVREKARQDAELTGIYNQALAHAQRAEGSAASDASTARRELTLALQCAAGIALAPQLGAAMVFIPPGSVTLKEGDVEQEVSLNGFFIDRYEVSGQDFARFVSSAAWRMPPQQYAAAQNAAFANAAFYDAEAYTAWSKVLLDKDLDWAQPRLPTEAQWARAAYGNDASEAYPWGQSWQPDACNARGEDGVDGVAAGGAFPRDRSSFGVYDVAGNLSEWTRTPYRRLTQEAGAAPAIGHKTLLVVRGGNFGQPQASQLDERMSLANLTQGAAADFSTMGFRRVVELPADVASLRAILGQESSGKTSNRLSEQAP